MIIIIALVVGLAALAVAFSVQSSRTEKVVFIVGCLALAIYGYGVVAASAFEDRYDDRSKYRVDVSPWARTATIVWQQDTRAKGAMAALLFGSAYCEEIGGRLVSRYGPPWRIEMADDRGSSLGLICWRWLP